MWLKYFTQKFPPHPACRYTQLPFKFIRRLWFSFFSALIIFSLHRNWSISNHRLIKIVVFIFVEWIKTFDFTILWSLTSFLLCCKLIRPLLFFSSNLPSSSSSILLFCYFIMSQLAHRLATYQFSSYDRHLSLFFTFSEASNFKVGEREKEEKQYMWTGNS